MTTTAYGQLDEVDPRLLEPIFRVVPSGADPRLVYAIGAYRGSLARSWTWKHSVIGRECWRWLPLIVLAGLR